ncbi:hypothetical protein [Rhizobium sp. C4]|uniref:hypothetical protein n=1 Tax=Rhizobium sp. C4 TaxID=1349800 RepID=UPI001E2A3AB8|nr:hypothetical protein [Rhizobium sp. C4]MCD2173094.1 hypothetical protein [Rhizobium sp. C4]
MGISFAKSKACGEKMNQPAKPLRAFLSKSCARLEADSRRKQTTRDTMRVAGGFLFV